MRAVAWSRRRSIPLLVAVATLIPVCALLWLGLRVLEQDREADGQRQRERLEAAAARVALEIDRRLAGANDCRDIRVAPIDLGVGRLTAAPKSFSRGFLAGPGVPDWSPDGKYLAY